MDNMEHIRHSLCGVVDIALKVYQSRLLLQNPVLVALSHGVNHFMHIFVAFSYVHIVTDTDDIGHEGDHVGSLPDCLAVGNL